MNNLSLALGVSRPDLLRDETLVDIFKASAQIFHAKTALIFGDRALTYQELDLWSDAMARELAQAGICPGDSVGVWWPRSIELHVAILGILKAGAAYVPIDRGTTEGRVEIILQEVRAKACISPSPLKIDCIVISVIPEPKENSADPFIEIGTHPKPDQWAYVIYTSGSTGKPKGIPITHRQICQMIRAEQAVIQILPEDKVYQGISVSFDMWCEETWISYLVGASLWVADELTSKSIDTLGEILKRENISILHTVPSLLAVIDNDVPSLRIVNAGGEACTPQVVERWYLPNRILYNSYGPTETTVTATLTSLSPGQAITIGKPLPNYHLAVVDEHFQLVPVGEKGELVISGPGVCNGYIERPELTREKFVSKPESLAQLPGDRIYRTGDAATIHDNGDIEFHGRLDDQIKLRGYRIELGEIENKLNSISGVSAAAVAVKKDASQQEHLVGYVVFHKPSDLTEDQMKQELAQTLPTYMIPSLVLKLDEMPRLTSGKMDRKSLPIPEAFSKSFGVGADHDEIEIDPESRVQDRVLLILKKIFPNQTIDPSKDFFTQLGGHSLLAAVFVTMVRQKAKIPHASLRDVYLHRPIEKLIQHWDSKVHATPKGKKNFYPVKKTYFYVCWFMQTLSVCFFFTLFAAQIIFPYLGYYFVMDKTSHYGWAVLTSLAMFCLTSPILMVVTIASKWLVIGKMKAGDYPLWGSYYFRWWFVKSMQNLLPSEFLNGTPLHCDFLRIFGAKVAPDAQLSNFSIGAEDLLTIGKNVTISSQVLLDNAFVEDGLLKLREIHIEDNAYIGSSSVVAGGAKIEQWGELKDLSFLPDGQTIQTGEIWQGSPAQFKEKRSPDFYPKPLLVSDHTRKKYSFYFQILLFAVPLIILVPLLPILYILYELDESAPDYDFSYMIHIPMLALIYILVYALITIALSRWLNQGIKVGRYPIYSRDYLKKWFNDQLMTLALTVLRPVYATVFVPTFFRLLGAKIGKNAEISTASSVTHPLLEIGNGSFIADAVTLGESDVRGQELILEYTRIGEKTFVGNSALVPQGTHLGNQMLIGVLSTPPSPEQQQSEAAKDWFGSPPIAIPRRQQAPAFSDKLTLHRSTPRLLARSFVEVIRIILPQSVILICSILFIAYGHDMLLENAWWKFLLLMPLHYLRYFGLPIFGFIIALKWIFVGIYNTEQKPMWSLRVWLSEGITSAYETLACPFFLNFFKGTPWLPIFLRPFGVKTGKRVWMNTVDITEFDLVEIGDDTALNKDCGPQTHLFEDRIMKIGPVKIGARCTIGSRSIILYDSVLEDDVHLSPLSLVMKGEVLHSKTSWVGSPVRPA